MCSTALFATVLLFLPETSWPLARGIDKIREAGEDVDARWNWLRNPFKHISILRSPNVLAAVRLLQMFGCFEGTNFFPLPFILGPSLILTVPGGSIRIECQL
jgi:hypothetical protein